MGEAQGRSATGPTHWFFEFPGGASPNAPSRPEEGPPDSTPPDLAQFTAKLYTAVAEAGHIAVAIHPT
eukprot:1652400-Heterocapsa_arctica.AAC.1